MTGPTLDGRTWRLAGVVVVGALLSTLEASIVAVGLDTIAVDLGVGLDDVSWVSNAYLLALAVSLPACGWLGRRVGVGRLWLLALAGFTATSLLCALAGSLPMLLGSRVLQGLCAGVLVPSGQTLLGQAVGPERLGRVMGVLGFAVSAGPALGPVVGGVLVQTLSWPWLFAVNVPVGLLGLVAGWFVVPRGQSRNIPRPDLLGLALITIGLPVTLYALTSLTETTRTALVLLVVGVAALIGFVVRSLRTARPLTELRLCRDHVFAAACAASSLFGAVMFSSLLVLPLWFQLRQGATAFETGLSLISFGFGTAVTAPLAGGLIDRFGAGPVATLGSLAVVVTTAPFAVLDAAAPPVLLQGLLLTRGAATALAALPPTVAAYAAVSAEALPDAATQLNVAQRVGGAAGGATVALVIAQQLPRGTETAFAAAFTAVTGLGLAASAAALWLWHATRPRREVGVQTANR